MKNATRKSIHYLKFDHSRWEPVENGVISEASVDLMVNGKFWVSWLCTPTQLEELAVGFLYNEGVIDTYDEVSIVRLCDLSNVDVWLTSDVEPPAQWRRTSGCGGGSTQAAAPVQTIPPSAMEKFDPAQIPGLMDKLLESQELYHEVRGVHCSILTDGIGLRAIAEDIGRHNTLDKIAGQMLRMHLPFEKWIILTTGRISSEMLQKSARMGAYMVVSRTSPSSLSIELARQLGITLVGYARGNHFNVYSYPERLGGSRVGEMD